MSDRDATTKPAARGARARIVTVGQEHAGQRLDNFLSACFRDVPRSRIYRSVRTGEVRVNRGRARQTYRLKEGDEVRLPPLSSRSHERPPLAADPSRIAALHEAVLLEDDDLLVINKPAGLPVHAGSGRSHGLIELLKADPQRGKGFIELVHRLDQETSGALLLAKRRSVLVALHAQLREGRMDKRYRVLLKGCWRGGGRRVDAPLARAIRNGERVVRVDPGGQAARTAFTPLHVGERVTLMEARPVTGRTHQIRVHAAQVLHMPVVGDPRYGDWALNRELAQAGWKRMFLHARRLGFTHPRSGEPCRVEAPLEPALLAMLDHFQIASDRTGQCS